MQARLALILLGLCWAVGFTPAATITYEATSIQLTLIESLPAVTALLFVTTAILGLASYLRKSPWPVLLALVTALAQWLPVLSLSSETPALLAKYAELSGVDLSSSGVAPDTIQVLATVWLYPAISIALAIFLLSWFTKRRSLERSQGTPAVEAAAPAKAEAEDLWTSQLLDSRGEQKG